MGFSARVSPSQLLGSFIGLVILGFAVRFLAAGGIEEYFNPNKRIENKIVAALEKQPGNLALMQAMEDKFPLEYDDFLEAMTSAAAAGDAQITEQGNAWLTRFYSRHSGDFGNAPDAALARVMDAESRLLARLAAGSKIDCADYVFGTLQPEIPLPAETRKLLVDAVTARVNAISAGRTQQTMRLLITPNEVKLAEDAMKARGASADQLALFDGRKDSEALSIDDQCAYGINLVEAIRAQEPSEQALLTVALLQRR